MRGGRFVYAADVVAPAELPADLRAFKAQQHRWAKGSAECAVKLLPAAFWVQLIAALSTMLQRGPQTHQAHLSTHMSLYEPDVWERYHTLTSTFAARGADTVTAEHQAWAHMYEVVQRQALSLSFIDNFWLLVWIFLAVIPFVLFLGRGPRGMETPADSDRPALVVEG